jgi:cytochrome P450
LVVVCEADVAKKLLTTTSDYVRDANFQKLWKDISTWALFLIPYGNDWKKHRKLLQPAFGPSHLKSALEVSKKVCEKLKLFVREQAEKESVVVLNVHQVFTAVTLEVMQGFFLFFIEKRKLFNI